MQSTSICNLSAWPQKRLSIRSILHVVTIFNFDPFETKETYDLILFYECFHHSVGG
jgi:hypothetical protein